MFYGSQSKKITKTETILREFLCKTQLRGARFRKQHPIADYIADFYCHEFKLVIEVDRPIRDTQKEYDHQRTQQFSQVDLSVTRLTNNQIMFDIDSAKQNQIGIEVIEDEL